MNTARNEIAALTTSLDAAANEPRCVRSRALEAVHDRMLVAKGRGLLPKGHYLWERLNDAYDTTM